MDQNSLIDNGMTVDQNGMKMKENGKIIDDIKNNDYEKSEKTYSSEVIIEQEKERRLYYRVSESPPVYLSVLFALQQSVVSIPKCVVVVAILAEIVCAADIESIKAKMFATTLLMAGLTTLSQNTFGIRLPVYQGPMSQYVIPLLALTYLPQWKCPPVPSMISDNGTVFGESEELENYTNTYVLPKLQQFQGSLALAGFVHMLIGMTGVLGVLLRYIGPLTVVTTLMLIAIKAYPIILKFCASSWPVTSVTCLVTLVLSLFLAGRKMPIPVWTKSKGLHIIRYPLQQVLSILVGITVGWTFSYILTSYDVLSSSRDSVEYYARTDTKTHVIKTTPWFYVPHPGNIMEVVACGAGNAYLSGAPDFTSSLCGGQFGSTSFSPGVFITFLIPTLISILDSIADYYACARTVLVPTPPQHAINRGIAVEGFFSMIAGFFGASHATTTYGGNIGIIGMTKVASRRVFQHFALQMMFVAMIGKFAAFFVTIPYPVLGGIQVISFGIFIGLVLANLQYVDLGSTRNLSVIGIPLLLGLMIPTWSKDNTEVFQTGSRTADDIILLVMTHPSLFGGVLTCILDNVLPGTLEERGMIAWQSGGELTVDTEMYEEGREVYDIPILSRFLRRFRFSKYVPFFPTYQK